MRLLRAVLLCSLATPLAAQSSFQFHGFLSGRAIDVKAQPSWTEGGAGRFDVGAKSADDRQTVHVEVAQLGVDWMPTSWLAFHADGVGRREPSGTEGRRAGVVQAFGDLYNEHWRFRAGTFWLPTSRENTDPMWNSPYTITYSALNTWIGEEVRPVGADLQFSPNFYFTLGATAIRGNDTMGTELAARGWTFGNRLSVYDEELPMPGTAERTRPVGADLDGRWGHSERLRVQLPERASLQLTHIDNRAELKPQIGEYTPWQTRFNILGGTVGPTSPITLSAEWAKGSTAVGFPGGSFTMDFDTAYVLLSQKKGLSRWTVRLDRFSTRSHKPRPVDLSRESGHAVTVAWFREMRAKVRTGLEYAKVKGDRPGLAGVGLDPNAGGSTITFEIRYGF
jgi:hypothetical protein